MDTDVIKDWVVVVVDDELHNLGVAQKVLTYNGAEVHTARDGVEGLALVEQVRPTFILLDLSMPNMDGWEMHNRLRYNPQTREIPVIALTAHAMHGDREKVIEAGFDGYISKPFRIDSFLDEIFRFLSSARS